MKSELTIRPFEWKDEQTVVNLWKACELVVPWNDPHTDIKLKINFQPDLFLIGELDGKLIASVMAGYEGHRGWINYLAVHPDFRGRGFGKRIMSEAELKCIALGCVKINLQVRGTNTRVIKFYQEMGYNVDEVVSLGKRLDKQIRF